MRQNMLIVALAMFLIGLALGYALPKTTKPFQCPEANGKNDKLVSIVQDGNKIICIYTMESFKQKRKYTKEMWLE